MCDACWQPFDELGDFNYGAKFMFWVETREI